MTERHHILRHISQIGNVGNLGNSRQNKVSDKNGPKNGPNSNALSTLFLWETRGENSGKT